MITPINNLMNIFQDLGMDMFHSISLSSNANAVKHKMLYEDFDVNENYDIETDDPYFIPTMQWAKAKVEAYNEQDEKANEKLKKVSEKMKKLNCAKLRDVSKNITAEQLFEFCKKNIKCYMCHVAFTAKNKPTLDRVDNSKCHSLDNVEACCLYCNRVKSDNDKGIVQFKIQLRKYCVKNNLPMTLSDEVTHHILRDGITGGSSDVGHRFNIAGETKINKFEIVKYGDGSYQQDVGRASQYHVFSVDSKYVMTHICGCDFSSLYPSVYSSNKHPFIRFTGHKMYMPGYQLDRFNTENGKDKMRDVIYNHNRFECDDGTIISKLPYFVAVVKGHIDEE
jgi:hypothetical protein